MEQHGVDQPAHQRHPVPDPLEQQVGSERPGGTDVVLHPHKEAAVDDATVGESHAWVAAFTGTVWPLDPTSLSPVAERHVRVAAHAATAGHGVVFTTDPTDLRRLLADHPTIAVEKP